MWSLGSEALESDDLGFVLAQSHMCDLGHVMQLLCDSVSPTVMSPVKFLDSVLCIVTVLVIYICLTKYPKTWWLKVAKTYYLTIP